MWSFDSKLKIEKNCIAINNVCCNNLHAVEADSVS